MSRAWVGEGRSVVSSVTMVVHGRPPGNEERNGVPSLAHVSALAEKVAAHVPT